jgi:hypothetical protein
VDTKKRLTHPDKVKMLPVVGFKPCPHPLMATSRIVRDIWSFGVKRVQDVVEMEI